MEQFRFSEVHRIAAVSGEVIPTREAATAKMSEDLAEAAAHAGEAVEVGQCVAVEGKDPDAAAPCHILQVVHQVYDLPDTHTSPPISNCSR